MSEKIRNSIMLAATTSYMEKIKNFADNLQMNFTDYQQDCGVNAIRTLNTLIIKAGFTWQSFDIDNILTTVQQAVFLETNASAIPRECFFIIRKEKSNTGVWSQVLEYGIEGAGNDRILLKFGQDVKELKSYIVYEGDEFTEGFLDGWEMTLPKYRRKFITNKPLKVVYLIKKTNGEIDVQYADTQDVMKSLLAQAKQNLKNAKGANENKLLRELAKLDLYTILEDEKWLDYELTKSGYNNSTYKTSLFSPSYTSPISMYNMIERKLRNHATRKYPKNFNHKEVSALYEDTFDEKYNEKGDLIGAEEQVQIASDEVEEKTATKPVFKEVEKAKKVENDDRPPLKVEKVEEVKEETVYQDDQFGGENQEQVETVIEQVEIPEIVKEQEEQEEKPVQQSLDDDSEPDWFN